MLLVSATHCPSSLGICYSLQDHLLSDGMLPPGRGGGDPGSRKRHMAKIGGGHTAKKGGRMVNLFKVCDFSGFFLQIFL